MSEQSSRRPRVGAFTGLLATDHPDTDKDVHLMRTLLDSIRPKRSSSSFEREIAPGVTVRINRLPRTLSLMRSKQVNSLADRVHGAWDVLWGKAHAMPSPLQQRLRRAA